MIGSPFVFTDFSCESNAGWVGLGGQFVEELWLGPLAVIYYGVPFHIRRMTRFFAQFLRPGDLGFDLDTHVGHRIVAWRRLGVRVIAVEPQPDLVSLLLLIYGEEAGVEVVPTAVGARDGAHDMLISRRTLTRSTLSRDRAEKIAQTEAFGSVCWDHTHLVRVSTLDGLIAKFGVPDFCKIDLEGLECDVLRRRFGGYLRPVAGMTCERTV